MPSHLVKGLVVAFLSVVILLVYWSPGDEIVPQGPDRRGNQSKGDEVAGRAPVPEVVRTEGAATLPLVSKEVAENDVVEPSKGSRVWKIEETTVLLRSGIDEALRILSIAQSGEIVHDPAKLQLAQEALDDAKAEFRALFSGHGQASTKVAIALASANGGGKPPEGYEKRFRSVTIGSKTVYYTEADYPEVFQIEDSLLQVPNRLERKLQGIASGN